MLVVEQSQSQQAQQLAPSDSSDAVERIREVGCGEEVIIGDVADTTGFQDCLKRSNVDS
jgi:hypothetical protein